MDLSNIHDGIKRWIIRTCLCAAIVLLSSICPEQHHLAVEDLLSRWNRQANTEHLLFIYLLSPSFCRLLRLVLNRNSSFWIYLDCSIAWSALLRLYRILFPRYFWRSWVNDLVVFLFAHRWVFDMQSFSSNYNGNGTISNQGGLLLHWHLIRISVFNCFLSAQWDWHDRIGY